MNYSLNNPTGTVKKTGSLAALRGMLPFLADEKLKLTIAILAILVNSGLNLFAPVVVGRTVDQFIAVGQYSGVLANAGWLLLIYAVAFVAAYIQMKTMGAVGQRLLFKLRNAVFDKLQELPVAFFNQNKAGDLISRINNDTDKLNQFFSQSLMQFIGNMVMIIGAGIFLLTLHVQLGAAALVPALLLIFFTQAVSGWVRRRNAVSLKATGGMSAEIQESLENFKVIVAFDRRDYFRRRFQEANEENYGAATSAGVANNIFIPVYGFSSQVAQLIVLMYGILLIAGGHATVGLLISFLFFVNRFYDPLRQLAALWSTFQVALAGWDRISAILSLSSDLVIVPGGEPEANSALLEFRDVGFRYTADKEVLGNASFRLEAGKTYALVGPTGGGKTTTASLMARLYDSSEGTILLDGKDLRSYESSERTRRIGFILQEPFLFTGTLRENLLYGNPELANLNSDELLERLKVANMQHLLGRFEQELETPIVVTGDAMSLGQKQLVAFMRAVLRDPELLILDEATANIDTVTEQLLEEILKHLPARTTKVIIAHRLNTIENADEIFFVNAGRIEKAGSLEHAVEMLLHGKRQS